MGNGWEMGNVFIGVDLWLIFIFQGWEMGNVRESGIPIYCRDLQNRVRVRQGHWKCHYAIERI